MFLYEKRPTLRRPTLKNLPRRAFLHQLLPPECHTNSPQPSTTLRIYLIIQYILNSILAITIIAIMVLTLVKYNSTKSVKGAWPANAILSPTFLMLVVSVLNVFMDAINLLVQCCGARAIRAMGAIVTKVRNFTGFLSAVMPAIAAGFAAFAKNSTNGSDLWGWSCSDAADAMQSVNSSGTICMTNVSKSFSLSLSLFSPKSHN